MNNYATYNGSKSFSSQLIFCLFVLISWWAVLRWILFILMLCCLVSTHIVAWRIETTRTILPHQEHQTQLKRL